MTPDQYRELAEARAENGRYKTAIREALTHLSNENQTGYVVAACEALKSVLTAPAPSPIEECPNCGTRNNDHAEWCEESRKAEPSVGARVAPAPEPGPSRYPDIVEGGDGYPEWNEPTPTSEAERRVVETLKEAEEWCHEQSINIGAVDGYDYRSGEEFAYRSAALHFKKLAAHQQEKG